MIRRSGGAPLFVVGGVLLSIFCISIGRVAAAPASSITTTPVSADVNVKPGSTNTQLLQVMNNNPVPVQITLELDQFSANGTSGEATVTPISASDPSRTYVHFSQNSFLAQPGIWTPVNMTISLPKTASLGYYYAVLFKPSVPTKSSPHTTIIKGNNAVLILVDTQSGNEQRELQVANFSVSQKLYEYLPANFNITVHNNGNIYAAPAGNIFISKSSTFTHPVGQLDVNKGGGNVLPESNRVFSATWNDGFPAYHQVLVGGQPLTKNGKPVEKLKWDFTQLSKFRFGKYYAHLALVYNNGTQDIPIDSVVSFWVIPWKLMLAVLAIILLILFGLFGAGRSIYRRARKVNIPKKKSKVKSE